MGRRENPIVQCSKSLFALVTWLRAGRAEVGLTYHQLAEHAGFSADTLARAASGRSVPQNLSVVIAYAQACGRSAKEAERLWKHARRDEARAQGALSGHRGGAHISVVKDFADLHSAIIDLYQDTGSPPLRSLDKRIGGVGRLPRSTAGRVLKGRSMPSRAFVQAFAEACGVRNAELAEWARAWDRADADRRSTRARYKEPKPGSLQERLTTHDRVTPRDLQLLMSDLEASARNRPGIRLLVNIPDPKDADAQKSARMVRELLVDQAQRRGELACPQCRRPSFGYDAAKGWTAALCAICMPDRTTCSERQAEQFQDASPLPPRLSAPSGHPPLPRRNLKKERPLPTDPGSGRPWEDGVVGDPSVWSNAPQPWEPAGLPFVTGLFRPYPPWRNGENTTSASARTKPVRRKPLSDFFKSRARRSY
ncbi:helix-turn-helix transcriptional regulator [Streptomyces sp. NPDC003077]|uniref:helix-turn-helix domain-containing protein n=1 Tax=Streptomyces sp. NPDC003077 TaxID=3154443 RepID=UPI0033AB2009